jgi:proteasome assembly chaperone (PAC2) family protein
MSEAASDPLRVQDCPALDQGTLVLALTGWMDGGDVSTGTVRRLVDLLGARPIADINPEPFYLVNFPGTMEVAALFRPHVRIEGGLVQALDLPANSFFCDKAAGLVLFLGREPNLRWRAFADALFGLARRAGVTRVLFVGSFGGSVPHTREPRLFAAASQARLLPELERHGLRRLDYAGPGSLVSYLLTRAAASGLEMAALVAEVPGYLQGRNPAAIEAVTRRLAQILKLPLELRALRVESAEWEVAVTRAVEENGELAETVRQLEEAYDDELLKLGGGDV